MGHFERPFDCESKLHVAYLHSDSERLMNVSETIALRGEASCMKNVCPLGKVFQDVL
jgi:hypothetical protein